MGRAWKPVGDASLDREAVVRRRGAQPDAGDRLVDSWVCTNAAGAKVAATASTERERAASPPRVRRHRVRLDCPLPEGGTDDAGRLFAPDKKPILSLPY